MVDSSLSKKKGGKFTKRMSNVVEQGFPKCGPGYGINSQETWRKILPDLLELNNVNFSFHTSKN